MRTEPDEEMVTIEVPISELDRIAKLDPKTHGGPSGITQTVKAAKAAMASVKSPYDLWLDTVEVGACMDHWDPLAQPSFGLRIRAASLQLLDALVFLRIEGGLTGCAVIAAEEAIRAAVPTEVAEFLLNGAEQSDSIGKCEKCDDTSWADVGLCWKCQ